MFGASKTRWLSRVGVLVTCVSVATVWGCGKKAKITEHWDGKTTLISHSTLPKPVPASKIDFSAVKLGRETVNLTLPVDWKQKPQAPLHRWEWVWPMLNAYETSQDKESLRRSVELALDWIKQNPLQPQATKETTRWGSSTVAWRARALGYIIRAGAQAEALNGEEFERLMLAAREHASWLANDEHYRMGSAFRLYQDHGLAVLCKQLNKLADCQGWSAIARQRFLENIATVVDPKTGLTKGSPGKYHVRLVHLVQRMVDLTEDKKLADLLKNMQQASGWLVPPDGRFVLYGQSSHGKWPAWARNAGKNLKGLAPFADNGFGVVKHGDGFLFASASFHDKEDKQLDDLSFVWSDAGKRIIADAGYSKKGSLKKFARSAAAHNVLMVDGKDWRLRGKPYGSGIRALGEHEGWYAIQGTNPLLKKDFRVDHTRVWLYQPGKWLFVLDRVAGSAEHKYTRLFHFWHELKAELSEKGVLSTRVGKQLLEVRDISPAELKVEPKLVVGQNKPLQGFMMPKKRGKEKNAVLELTATGTEAILGVAFRLGEPPKQPEEFKLSYAPEPGFELKFGEHSLQVQDHKQDLILTVDGKVPDIPAVKEREKAMELGRQMREKLEKQAAENLKQQKGKPQAQGAQPGAPPAKPATAPAKPATAPAKPAAPPAPAKQ